MCSCFKCFYASANGLTVSFSTVAQQQWGTYFWASVQALVGRHHLSPEISTCEKDHKFLKLELET